MRKADAKKLTKGALVEVELDRGKWVKGLVKHAIYDPMSDQVMVAVDTVNLEEFPHIRVRLPK